MKATFIEDTDLRLGLSFEAETPEERLLLRAFLAQAQERDNRMRIRVWHVDGSRGPGVGAIRLYLDERGDAPMAPMSVTVKPTTNPLDPNQEPSTFARAFKRCATPGRGRLIVLEGLDGAGTTTQAKRLVDRLGERYQLAHLTREPSDNPIGRLLREFLIGGHALPAGDVRQETFALLFAADRLDHVQREVEPQLAAGKIVVSDRWYHSSFAYQGQGECQAIDPIQYAWIATLNQHALRPDLTIFLQVSPKVAANRRVLAGRSQELFEDLDTQRRVEASYRATIDLLRKRAERIEVLDGEQTAEEVSAQIMRLVDPLSLDVLRQNEEGPG